MACDDKAYMCQGILGPERQSEYMAACSMMAPVMYRSCSGLDTGDTAGRTTSPTKCQNYVGHKHCDRDPSTTPGPPGLVSICVKDFIVSPKALLCSSIPLALRSLAEPGIACPHAASITPTANPRNTYSRYDTQHLVSLIAYGALTNWSGPSVEQRTSAVCKRGNAITWGKKVLNVLESKDATEA